MSNYNFKIKYDFMGFQIFNHVNNGRLNKNMKLGYLRGIAFLGKKFYEITSIHLKNDSPRDEIEKWKKEFKISASRKLFIN